MNAVGAGLDGRVENGACGTAQFSAEIRGLHLELLNRVHRRQDDVVGSVQEVDVVRVVVDAVQQVVVLRGTKPVGRESARSRIAAGIGLRCLHAGAQLRKEGKVAPVKRKRVHFLLVDDLAD